MVINALYISTFELLLFIFEMGSFVQDAPIPSFFKTLEFCINVFHTFYLTSFLNQTIHYRTSSTKPPAKKVEEEEDDPEAEVVVSGTDVYKGYIGKEVKHKAGGTGVVTKCDGKYISIQFSNGPKAGQTINYSLEMCLKNGLIELI